MTIITGDGLSSERQQLPANRDLGRDAPLRDNPFSRGRNNEGLIGLYPYSGADAKLVVHLPPEDPETRDLETRRIQQELEEAQTNWAIVQDIEEELSQMESRLRSLRELEAQQITLVEITAEGTQERTDALQDVEDTREEIQEVRDIIDNAANNETREDLEARVADLQRLLEDREDPNAGSQLNTKVLGEIQTLSISVHREKYPVRTLGTVYPRSVTRGPRCLPATEKVLVKDKGYISIADIKQGDLVQSSNSSYDCVLGSWYQGEKFCYRVNLENGYSLIGSYDHPISTSIGWVNIENLERGDLVDVVASTPVSNKDYDISDDILKLIALLIGDGQIQKYKNTYVIALSIADKEMNSIGRELETCLNALEIPFRDSRKNQDKCIRRVISVCKKEKGNTDWRQREYNELHYWLLKFNMYGQYSYQKEIPQELISSMSLRQVCLFLRYLFSTDGCYSVSHDKRKKYIEAKYLSTSETLIDQIRLLLSKVGISSIKNKDSILAGKVGGRPDIISRHNSHTLVISSAFDLLRFYRRVGILGKDVYIHDLIPILKRRIRDQYLDISIKNFRLMIRDSLLSKNKEVSDFFGKHNLYAYSRGLTPRWALKVTDELNLPEISQIVEQSIDRLLEADTDYIPRKVLDINPIGYLPVYDLEVEKRHAFIANFIRVHNTISGSMVFATFNQHIMAEFLETTQYRSTGVGDWDRFRWTSYIMDQIPPLDISICWANEYGNLSWSAILGVEFVNEGQVISIEDLYLEGTAQYIARDYDPIRSVANRRLSRNRGVGQVLSGTSLSVEHFRRRVANRNNPWI